MQGKNQIIFKKISTRETCINRLINEVIHIIHIKMNGGVKSYGKLKERLFCEESRKCVHIAKNMEKWYTFPIEEKYCFSLKYVIRKGEQYEICNCGEKH